MINKNITLLAFTLCFVLSFTFVLHASAQIDLLDHKSIHDQAVAEEEGYYEYVSRAGDPNIYYYFGVDLNGMLSAVEGNGDEILLQKVIQYVDNMINANGNNGAGWIKDTVGGWRGATPIARAAAIIMRDPVWRAKYGRTAREYIDFIYTSIIYSWYEGNGYSIPCIHPYSNSGEFCFGWHDSYSNLGMLATNLFQAEDPGPSRDLYLDIATKIAKAFRLHLELNGTGWIFDNDGSWSVDYRNEEGVPDTSHANQEPRMMMFMHEAGIEFSREEIVLWANTLTDIIWNGSLETPLFANYINGSNKPYAGGGEWSNGHIVNGWAFLGGYSSRAQEVLAYRLKADVEGRGNWDERVILSGHLIRNQMLLNGGRTVVP
jgi:hypothetical protein